MNKKILTRRTFLKSSLAVVGVSALAVSGCSAPSTGESQSSENQKSPADTIDAYCSCTYTDISPVGAVSPLIVAAGKHVFESLYEIDLSTSKTYAQLSSSDPNKLSDTLYEVGIREDACFSDGTKVSAQDVVNAFHKNMESESYHDLLSFIKSVTAKSESVVTFELNYAIDTLFKKRLSLVKIFPKSQSDEQMHTMPIGSGPWKYEIIDSQAAGEVIFSANTNYSGARAAKSEKMVWHIEQDGENRASGAIQRRSVVVEDAALCTLEKLKSDGMTIEYTPGFSPALLVFNTKKAYLSDKRVRQAILYAIDVDKLISNNFEGHARSASSFLPETNSNYHKTSTVFSLDPERAKGLLSEAKVETIPLTLATDGTWVKALTSQIQENLSAIGISATVREESIDWATLGDEGGVPNFDVALISADPSCLGSDADLLMIWFYGNSTWARERSCWSSTPEWQQLQDLLVRARSEKDSNKQQNIWNECFDIIADSCPIYPLFHREVATAYRADYLENFTPLGSPGVNFIDTTVLQ